MKRAALIASIVGLVGVPVLTVPVLTAAAYAQDAGLTGGKVAAPSVAPTDEQIEAAIAQHKSADKSRPTVEVAREAFKDISLAHATRAQIERLQVERLLILLPDQWDQAKVRLEALAQEESIEGARAAELLIGVWGRPRTLAQNDVQAYQQNVPKFVAAGLRHPKFVEAVKAGYGQGIIGGMQTLSPELLRADGTLEAARRLLKEDLPVRSALAMGALFQTVSDEKFGADRALIDEIRTETAALYDRTLRTVEAELADLATKLEATPDDAALKVQKTERERMKSFIARTKKYMNGAFARGELLNHPAPDITFSWSTMTDGVTKLSDLKGKVVVLDFWATWCGPCIGSFPNIRTLQERYKDYPVVILGVTSLQGFHIDYKATDPTKRRIDTSGNASLETELMRQFIKDMEMTWAVAFGVEDVFNPEYGVQGIPHVAIVDPAGVVRFRGLHPGGDPAEEAEKIDGLLKEFKLPHPGSPLGMK